jgi:hypothetical protein
MKVTPKQDGAIVVIMFIAALVLMYVAMCKGWV